MKHQHGGDIYQNQVTIDFSANISPLGMPKGVKEAAKIAVDCSHHYPDCQYGELKEAIALYEEVRKDQVIAGNGAADLIFQLVWALKPKKAFLLSPSFFEYEQALCSVGCEIYFHELKKEESFQLMVQSLIKEMEHRKGVNLLFICNPNNPTGQILKKQDAILLANYCESHGIFLVFDECFMDFVDLDQGDSFLPLIQNYSYVFLLKAFTKMFAMPGLRLGYGICNNSELMNQMDQMRQPWSISNVAQQAGIAALKEVGYIHQVLELINQERPVLRQILSDLGFFVYDSVANYLFFYDEYADDSLYHGLLKQGILIRDCSNYRGLKPGYYRICIKTPQEHKRLRQAMEVVLRERG